MKSTNLRTHAREHCSSRCFNSAARRSCIREDIRAHCAVLYWSWNSSCTASVLTTTRANFRIRAGRCWTPLSYRSKFTIRSFFLPVQFLFRPYIRPLSFSLFFRNFFAVISAVTLQLISNGAKSIVVIICNSSRGYISHSRSARSTFYSW